jgi:DNA polymerase
MRNVWGCTRPLTATEWNEYHAAEVINDRGVAVDQEFAEAATRYASAETVDLNRQLADVTQDPAVTVTHHLRKAAWLHAELWPAPELQALCVRKPTKRSKDQGITRLSADRSTREVIADALASREYGDLFQPAHLDRIQQFLEIIEAGNSAAVNKFKAIARTAYEGRVHGQYSFNGGGQTGRFSSRGVQIHNLIRKTVDPDDRNRSIDAMEDVLNGASAESLAEVYELPLSRLLSRLLRPTLIAPEGKLLVWGDWDQIEARVLPWLSNSPGGEAKLDVFRNGDDVYRITAGGILGKAVAEVSADERQAFGKVPELALGFGGSVGAFAAMGRNYGVVLPEDQVRSIVEGWRRVNAWARTFWDALWNAAMAAWADPGTWYSAGRVRYLFHPQLMRGTLICSLPDGRWLVYPQLLRDEYEHTDPTTGVVETRRRVSFLKGYGSGVARVALWYGTLAENITQATAASILRRALVRLQGVAVLHTHDEVGVECDEANVAQMRHNVQAVMENLPDWATGLPLTVSVDSSPFYTK